MEDIIVASRNKKKISELQSILRGFGMRAVARDDAGIPEFEIKEDGDTFEENSYKKAEAILDFSGKITIADDSGLCVDALDGLPGVHSARYAGSSASDADNNRKLLYELKDVSADKRGAEFVSVITMLFPDGREIVARGECRGMIDFEEHGGGGFGYDPLFIPIGYSESFAELAPDEKNKISHRGRALCELAERLREIMKDE